MPGEVLDLGQRAVLFDSKQIISDPP